MSRWINSFNTHAFQTAWKAINELAQTLSVPDATVVTNVEELARLKKVISYIDELVKASDPELIPTSIWTNFNDQANPCLEQMKQFNSNKNIGHLNNANNHLDNILTYIRPYVVDSKSAAQAATAAFKTYSDTVNQQIGILQSNTKDTVAHIAENKTKSDKLYNEIDQSRQNIQKLEAAFLKGDEKEKSLQERMRLLFDEATGWYNKIGEFHKKLTTGSQQEAAIALQIEEAKNKVLKNSEAIANALKASEDSIKDLKGFYVQIFGEKDKDGKLTEGLKQELEKRLKELDDFKREQKTAYGTLLKEIESLLPGATSAGLASAYHELKESFNWPIRTYLGIFYGALAAILCVGSLSATHRNGSLFIELVDISKPEDLLNSALYKLPILGVFLWLAMFASKRRSEDRRLQQEYAHKESIAKSYQSFKKQIEDLQTKDTELMKKLLDTAIDAIAFNASTTLDGKHGDKMPMQELAEKFADKAFDTVVDIAKAKSGKS